jgi:hypothetical protein
MSDVIEDQAMTAEVTATAPPAYFPSWAAALCADVDCNVIWDAREYKTCPACGDRGFIAVLALGRKGRAA